MPNTDLDALAKRIVDHARYGRGAVLPRDAEITWVRARLSDAPAPRPDIEEYRALLADKLCSGPRLDEKQLRELLDYIDRCETGLIALADEVREDLSTAVFEQVAPLVEDIRRAKS